MQLDAEHPLDAIAASPLAPWARELRTAVADAQARRRHGELAQWRAALQMLPALRPDAVDLTGDRIVVGRAAEADPAARSQLESALRQLIPWRKGPFELFGVVIDSEWRSDWKWRRLAPHIAPLAGRHVLDVGCSNGYHCWRMRGAGARWVLGIEPSWLYVTQFAAVQHYIQDPAVGVLPLRLEDLPADMTAFDSVFSMGVLYHRRDPAAHLRALRPLLKRGGELILETLVIPGDQRALLQPQARYAKMRNVWAIPSVAQLLHWLEDTGFGNARIVDITMTTPSEQRRTAWMPFESLADFLHPDDASRTVEDYPAPRRAIALANCC